jgi:hypothetical protein
LGDPGLLLAFIRKPYAGRQVFARLPRDAQSAAKAALSEGTRKFRIADYFSQAHSF